LLITQSKLFLCQQNISNYFTQSENKPLKMLLWLNRNTKKWAIAGIALLLSLIALEILLTKLDIPKRSYILQIGWNSKDIAFSDGPFNEMGFRGLPLMHGISCKRILLIGDSQLEAGALPFQYTLERLLEERLQKGDGCIEVRSLGSGGYGQDQQLLALREYYNDYSADHVILWLTPENDIWNNMFPTHWPWNGNAKPTFWLMNDSLAGPSYRFRETLKFDADIKILRIFAIIRENLRMRKLDTKWENRLPSTEDVNFTSNIQGSSILVDISGQEELLREKSHFTIFQGTRTKRMEYGIQLTRRLLEEISHLCEQNGATFSIFYIDSQFIRDVENEAYAKDPQSNRYYQLERDSYARTVLDILEDFDARFINLQTPWRAMSMQDRFHLNHVAQKELADSLQTLIQPKFSKIDS
jgi:hypothetical protein